MDSASLIRRISGCFKHSVALNFSQFPSATIRRLLYVFLGKGRCEGVSQETLATWLLRLSPSTRWLGGVFRKTPGTCPRPSGHFGRSLVTLFLELPATPHGSQTIHRVAHGSHRFIVCACVDLWSPQQAVCHQTWSPLQAGCHHHDTARFNTIQQIPTNRPYLALWGVINNPEPKPILGTPPTTWPSYACLLYTSPSPRDS